nr:MAG TPA: Receptor Binding Protein [Caudoviricetes sp.]
MAQETEKSFPFDAEETEKGFDKVYVADDFARYFRAFISSGIFMKDPTNLQVIANGDMTVTLKAGKMIIEGYRYDNSGDIIISIDPADGVLGRIDRISATWSKDDRDIHYTLQKGTPSYEPVAPECRRTEEYKDYVVADIYVAAGVIKIQQQNITDQRLNTEVCGLAVPFTEINTDNIFTQYQDAVNEFLKFADTCIEGTVVGQIEADLAKKLDKTGNSGDNVVEFTQTSSRQNIMTGDTHKTMFGKIKKWLADLAAAAFMQTITSYSDLMAGTAIADYLVNAKAVQDGFNTVNGKLSITNNVFGINTSIGISVVSANCSVCVNNMYYIDAFVQLTETVPENGTLFYVVKNDNVITFNRRLDAIILNTVDGKIYQIVLLKDSNVFIATGRSIPSGFYKVTMIISI